MRPWKPDFANHPGHGALVWRYLPFNHLVDLISNGRLYLRRLDHLDEFDADEGRWMVGRESLQVMPEVGNAGSLLDSLELARHRTFVSCWTLRLAERQDMWDRLSPSVEPVAIVAEYESLFDALDASPVDLAIGGVSYADHVSSWLRRPGRLNSYRLAFCKRTRFSDEQEIRIAHQDFEEDTPLDDHVYVPIELGRLRAARIVVSSVGGEQLRRRVSGTLSDAAVDFPVSLSSL